MPKHYICDNPHCACTFQVEPHETFCENCSPLAREWAAKEKTYMAAQADDFAKRMTEEKQKFFASKTPVTQKTRTTPPKVKRAKNL